MTTTSSAVGSGASGTATSNPGARRFLSLRTLLAVGEVLLPLMVVVLMPTAFAPVLVLIGSTCGLLVVWFGRSYTLTLLAVQGAGLFVLGLWSTPPHWLLVYLAWAIGSVLVTFAIDRLATGAEADRSRYDGLVNGIDAIVWESTGETGTADFVSERIFDLLGLSPEQCRDLSFLTSRVHPDDLAAVIELRAGLNPGDTTESHFRIRDGWNRWRYVQHRVRSTMGADGRVFRRGVLVDETARWEAESIVRRYSDFIEGIPIALLILRLDDIDEITSLRLKAANPAASAVVRIDVPSAVDRPLAEVLPSRPSFMSRLADVVRLNEPMELPFVEFAGVDEVFALRAVPLPDQCIGVSLEDVTKRTRLAESFRHQALHDPLTGLPNRVQLHERLTSLLEHATVDDRTALLMIDLDQFKEVNDALGHAYGDRLLIEIARRLGRTLRHCDTIARLGGDEFAVLLPPGASPSAFDIADQITRLCDEPFQIDGYRIQVSASIGIAEAPEHARDTETLIRRADSAMYRAKRAGGGCAMYSPGQDLDSVRRLGLLADLRDALHDDSFVIHYQPRFALPSLRPVGVEALVRWRHPEHGLLLPAEFIELAEVSGAIQQLTQLVTTRAIDEVGELAADKGMRVSVNLSIRNLYDPTLVGWVGDLIRTADLPSGLLCFELIESRLMDDPSQAMVVLDELRRLGVRLSVDDFGTGYSSLAYLRELPIDEVKIDRSFVSDLERGDARIVRSVIELGHNLGLHVVAEGVESPVALDRLCELDCDSAQGFHLAAPLPPDELVRLLVDRDRRAGRPAWEPSATAR